MNNLISKNSKNILFGFINDDGLVTGIDKTLVASRLDVVLVFYVNVYTGVNNFLEMEF